jgi:hypothetical protein
MLSVSCIRWNLAGMFFKFWATAAFGIFGLVYINLFNNQAIQQNNPACILIFGDFHSGWNIFKYFLGKALSVI